MFSQKHLSSLIPELACNSLVFFEAASAFSNFSNRLESAPWPGSLYTLSFLLLFHSWYSKLRFQAAETAADFKAVDASCVKNELALARQPCQAHRREATKSSRRE